MAYENLKFEFAHLGVNAQSEQAAADFKGFLENVMHFHDAREIPASFFIADSKMELMKKGGKGTFGHIGFFVNDMKEGISYLESMGFTFDYENARYDEKNERIRLIWMLEEINGFRFHLVVKEFPFYV